MIECGNNLNLQIQHCVAPINIEVCSVVVRVTMTERVDQISLVYLGWQLSKWHVSNTETNALFGLLYTGNNIQTNSEAFGLEGDMW